MLDVAILGCGRWGNNHLKTLARLRDSGLINKISVVDVSQSARDSATQADFVFKSMDGVSADLVIVATHSDHHAIHTRELMAAGYRELVEKQRG